jgi:hypothetical protein
LTFSFAAAQAAGFGVPLPAGLGVTDEVDVATPVPVPVEGEVGPPVGVGVQLVPDPFCDTAMFTGAASPAFTVIIANRPDEFGLRTAVAVKLSPLAPVVGVTLNQLASSETDQVASFVVTVTADDVPPASLKDSVEALADSSGVAPGWVTVTVAVAAPAPSVAVAVNVTVAVRGEATALGSAVAVTVAPSVPDAGARVSHVASVVAAHPAALVDTVNVPSFPAPSVMVSGLADRLTVCAAPAACVTVTVTGAAPAAFTVTVAERAASVEFGSAVTVNVPPSVPELADSLSQSASSDNVHPDVFVETVTASEVPPAAATLNESGFTARVGDPAA